MISTNEPITSFNGFDIFVNADGKFSATVDGKKISRTTLAAVKKHIEERESPLVAYQLDTDWNGGRRIRKREIIGFKDGRPRDVQDGVLNYNEHVFVCSEQDLIELEAIAEEAKQINDRWVNKKKSLTQVTDGNFKKLQGSSLV